MRPADLTDGLSLAPCMTVIHACTHVLLTWLDKLSGGIFYLSKYIIIRPGLVTYAGPIVVVYLHKQNPESF